MPRDLHSPLPRGRSTVTHCLGTAGHTARCGLQAQVAADDLLHDLGCAAVDAGDPGVGVGPGNRVLGHVPVPPWSCTQTSTTRPCSSVHHHLAIDASSAVSSPALRASTQRSMYVWPSSISVAISAIRKRVFWKAPTAWPKAWRSVTYDSV